MIPFMLLEKGNEALLGHPDYVGEIKSDGERIGVEIDNEGKITIWNRRGFKKNTSFPEVIEAVKQLELKDTILDGELVMPSAKGNDNRIDIIRRSHIKNQRMIDYLSKKNPLTYRVFDIIRLNGINLMDEPLLARKYYLKELLKDEKTLEYVGYETDTKALWEKVLAEGLEGLVMKKKDSIYEGERRSSQWLKLKSFQNTVLTFTGYENHPKGITLTNPEGHRCSCSGEQHRKVKEKIDKDGYAEIIIQYLDQHESGMYDQITFKGMKK